MTKISPAIIIAINCILIVSGQAMDRFRRIFRSKPKPYIVETIALEYKPKVLLTMTFDDSLNMIESMQAILDTLPTHVREGCSKETYDLWHMLISSCGVFSPLLGVDTPQTREIHARAVDQRVKDIDEANRRWCEKIQEVK